MKKLAELRKRVIERDRHLQEKAEESDLVNANKEALLEMTGLSAEEIDRIEKDIDAEFTSRRKNLKIITIIGFALLVVIGMVFLYTLLKPLDNTDKATNGGQAIIIEIDSRTHHLGDNPGNEGTVFSRDFTVTDVSRFSSAVIEITFTKWGPNSAEPPRIFINSNPAGTVIENLPAPGTDECWQGPVSDGSYDYNCEYTYKKEILGLLKTGTNNFIIKNKKKGDDFLFRDIRITCIIK